MTTISELIGQYFSIMVLPKMKWNGDRVAIRIKRSKSWAFHDRDRQMTIDDRKMTILKLF